MKKLFSATYSIVLSTLVFLFFNPSGAKCQLISKTGSLKMKRERHQMQPLPGGKALIFGGISYDVNSNVIYPKNCEIYNSATGLWSTAGSMNRAIWGGASLTLSNGKILSLGDSVEEYNPVTDKWTFKSKLNKSRYNHCAILMTNGKILVMGGDDSTYESSNDDGSSWTLHKIVSPKFKIPTKLSLINLNDGRVLCLGYHENGRNRALLVSLALTIDTAKNIHKYGHSYNSLGKLTNGKILVVTSSKGYESEIFDPVSNTFSLTGWTGKDHDNCPLIPLTNGRFAIVGIVDPLAEDKLLEIFDPVTGKWTYSAGVDILGLNGYKIAPLGNNKWLIAGGTTWGLSTSFDSYIFNGAGQGSSINENLLPEVKMFYNPDLNTFNIKLDENSSYKNHKAYFYNSKGTLIQLNTIEDFEVTINLPELPSGFYMVRLINEQTQKIVTRKFIVH